MKKFLSPLAICLLFALKAYPFTQIVTVANHVFTPKTFTINLGDSIKWVWVSGSHTTTSLGIPAGAVAWNKSINSSTTTFIYVPAVAGAYNYKCTPHQGMGMVGNFTVTASCPAVTVQISASSATTFCKGGSVLLTSTVTGGVNAYQWKKNGTNIAGATTASFSATTTGSYTLFASNNCGKSATSNAISVTVNALPAATITPSGTKNICSGDSLKLLANTGTGLTYQWTKNAVNIAGATKSSYTAKTAGNYRVVVTRTATGCKKTSAITKITVTVCADGIAKLPENKIKVFPNPSAGDFHISLPVSTDKLSLSIFDNTGNLVETKPVATKDISFGGSLKPGIYLIQLRNSNKIVFEEKIVKE